MFSKASTLLRETVCPLPIHMWLVLFSESLLKDEPGCILFLSRTSFKDESLIIKDILLGFVGSIEVLLFATVRKTRESFLIYWELQQLLAEPSPVFLLYRTTRMQKDLDVSCCFHSTCILSCKKTELLCYWSKHFNPIFFLNALFNSFVSYPFCKEAGILVNFV